jgi:hypothetical protein
MKWDLYNNKMPLTILMLITVLNVGLVINLLIAHIGSAGLALSGMQIYVLAGLELAGVIFAYVVGKRRTTIAYF